MMDYSKLPAGFTMALAQNPVALNVYSAMTEEQKKNILERAHKACSNQEMHQIVNGLAANRLS